MKALKVIAPVLLVAGLVSAAAPARAPQPAAQLETLEQCLYRKGCVTNGGGAWLCPQQGDYEDCVLSTGG